MIKPLSLPRVDFVYINFHSADDTIASISSLLDLLTLCEIRSVIFVVDNSFVDNITDAHKLADFCGESVSSSVSLSYLPSDYNMGFGAGCNKASFLSTAPIMAFINCDTSFAETSSDSFFHMIQLLEYGWATIVGPRILSEDGTLHSSCFSFDPVSILLKPIRHLRLIGSRLQYFDLAKRHLKKRIDRITYEGLAITRPHLVDWLSGCCLLVRSDFFRLVGGFDNSFFLYFEDVDLCRKSRQIGRPVVYYPDCTVIHRAAHSSARTKGLLSSLVKNRLARHHIRSWLLYIFKWRNDFVVKARYYLLRLFANSYASASEKVMYTLDFSQFRPLDSLQSPGSEFDI